MIPESSANATVSLYRAERFPDRWVKETDLLTGITASDATIVEHAGRLWMFATTHDGAGSFSDTLSIFHAAHLRGPWKPHEAIRSWWTRAARGRRARSCGGTAGCGGRCRIAAQVTAPGSGSRKSCVSIRTAIAQKLHGVIRPEARMARPAAAYLEPRRRVRVHRRRRAFAAQPHARRQARSLVRPARINQVRGRRKRR